MKPDWKDAPEWANWMAQDRDGEWWWYQNAPAISSHFLAFFAVFRVLLRTGEMERTQSFMFWYRTYGKADVAMISEPNPNWRETLESRPCQ